MNNDEFLNWIADRLVHVYGESPNVDFVHKLRALAQQCVCGEPDSAGTHRIDGPCLAPQPEQCKYGQEPKSCTSSPMDCQCAIDATLAQPEQEPSYWIGYGLQAHTEKPFDDATPLYTTPPQRTWIGLTDEDVMSITFNFDVSSLSLVAKAVEAKLKEKNMNNFLTKGNNNA